MVFGFFTYSNRLIDLFSDAVNVWLIRGDEDALEIAENAMLTARHKQRKSMIQYAATAVGPIEAISGGVGVFPTSASGKQTVALDTVKQRLEILLDKFEETQGINLKQARKAMKPENEKAVQKGDAKFFRTRYPDFPLWGGVPATRS